MPDRGGGPHEPPSRTGSSCLSRPGYAVPATPPAARFSSPPAARGNHVTRWRRQPRSGSTSQVPAGSARPKPDIVRHRAFSHSLLEEHPGRLRSRLGGRQQGISRLRSAPPEAARSLPTAASERILAEVHGVTERQRRWPRRVRIVSVEAVAEKWLAPRLAAFKAAHPAVAIELETNHRGVDPDRRDFDAWFAYTGETAAPRPVTCREDTLLEETLYEEDLLPVCSPALLAARGRPDGPGELDDWPLLYDLGWDADWS